MKKNLILLLLLISGCSFGQEAIRKPQGIKAEFSPKIIRAYQENSQDKITEFYEYLTLYSAEKDIGLQSEIEKNIYSVLDSEDLEMVDFTNPEKSGIRLSEFLNKIRNGNYRFQIKSQQSSDEIGLNQWRNQYELSVSKNRAEWTYRVSQTVYFEVQEKSFGSKTKSVWEMKLGNID